MERMRRSFRLHVYGYVVMPEHVHLLLNEPQQVTLADALKSLKQGVSRRLIGDAEHFWQKRYYDFNIRNYPQFVEKLSYVHRNPGVRSKPVFGLLGWKPVMRGFMRAPRGLAVEQFSPLRHRL